MNQAPGQTPQQAPGQPGPAATQARPPMYQPNQIRGLPMLSEEEKTKYEQGLRGLWNKINTSTSNSPEQLAARHKIIEFSRMLISKIQTRRNQAAQQQVRQQGGQGPASSRPTSASQQTPGPPQPAAPGQQQQQQPEQQQKQPQQLVGANATSIQGDTAGSSIPATQLQGAQGAAMPTSRAKVPDPYVQRSPGVNQGLPMAPHTASAADAARKQHISRASPATSTATNPQAQMPLQQHQGPQQAHASPINAGFPPMAQKPGQVHSPAPGQAARVQTPQAAPPGPARTLSHSAAMSLANQRAANTPGGASLPNQQSSVAAHSPAGGPTHQQGHPHAHPTQQQQQPLPPQAQQLQKQMQQAQQQPSQGHSQPPPQAQPQPPPQAHSQPQAQSQPQPPPQAPPQAQPQPPPQGPPQAQPQAQPHPPSQAQPQPSSQTQSQQSMVSKMPIPKQLPEKATTIPQGVSVGGGVNPGRPSMTQGSGTLGGVMNQPAVSRVPAYNHDAEGDHVLSKKKLDELVRQVCGGSAEGHEGSLLAPEVEENVLNMADMFVDGVLQDACRNAKERGSKVLEIRDIQMVLERTYNIRVPGYSSDELRTVRRVQPAAGWIAKMSAVQAAKVMPGKGDL
ncbi:hypothetical protein CDD82_7212 [Ophiocordyceps australis]|uniref:Transcription initiation factor TFIID subunit 12 domain-containing protein n=1 Tax=Ophiocordyceps australis TaxID=1399860 RepID=A0A2C5YTS5_9HYPO|nr:hypothetical protein CDD82_7212 [Ophiocordyceps australis]